MKTVQSKVSTQCLMVERKPGSVYAALCIVGDKWTPLLLCHLVEGHQTFSELSAALPGISPRTLSARLDALESKGIIKKKVYCEHPPRYTYGLTTKGKDLRAILSQMADWGEKYCDSK